MFITWCNKARASSSLEKGLGLTIAAQPFRLIVLLKLYIVLYIVLDFYRGSVCSLKDQSHSWSLTNYSQITHWLGLCVLVRRELKKCRGVGCRNHWRITHKSRMNRTRIMYSHWRITEISRTSTHTSKYGAVFHEHSTHAQRMNHWRSASKHARFTNVPRIYK